MPHLLCHWTSIFKVISEELRHSHPLPSISLPVPTTGLLRLRFEPISPSARQTLYQLSQRSGWIWIIKRLLKMILSDLYKLLVCKLTTQLANIPHKKLIELFVYWLGTINWFSFWLSNFSMALWGISCLLLFHLVCMLARIQWAS